MFDGLIRRILLGRVRGGVEKMLGTGWKGKAGAIAVMFTGAAGMLSGAACVAQSLVVEGNLGQWDRCWELLAGGFAMFGLGLSQYGTRQAVGRVELAATETAAAAAPAQPEPPPPAA